MPGTAITVTAGSYEGKEFEKWIAPLGINGSTEETVTFTMPNEDITVEAEFVDCYPLSVFDGTTLTSTPQKVNYSATVTAPATPEGMRFIGWTAEGITLTDPTASTLEFTMPANAVMLTSNYATLYTVTVEGGKITGADTTCQAIAGETISITADTVSGHNFTGWTGEGVIFDDATKATTTFTMPESDVNVTANHEQIKVTAPTAGTGTYTYNGEPKTYTFANAGNESYYELTGDSITQTDAGSKVTIALPDIFESMSYGDVINDNADIDVSAVADGKVTVTANKDLTGGDPLTFKVNVNANKEGVEDPFYYIIVTINAVAAEPVKLEAQTVIEALANDTASDEVKAIISNAVAALASADSIEAVNEIVAAAEKAVAEQKAAENTPDEPEEDGKYAACKDRVSGFCDVYNKFRTIPVLNFIFNCIHALVHIIAEIF